MKNNTIENTTKNNSILQHAYNKSYVEGFLYLGSSMILYNDTKSLAGAILFPTLMKIATELVLKTQTKPLIEAVDKFFRTAVAGIALIASVLCVMLPETQQNIQSTNTKEASITTETASKQPKSSTPVLS